MSVIHERAKDIMKQRQRPGSDARSIVAQQSAIRITQHFNASTTRVFNAWLDAESAGQWLFATALRPMTDIDIDARVGGTFRLAARQEGAAVAHTGRYVEILPHRHLAFTLLMAERPRSMTLVTVSTTPRSVGCELALSHEGVPLDCTNYVEGRWTGILHGLGIVLDATRSRTSATTQANWPIVSRMSIGTTRR
jgi:uncharacterized protein YndB with AHSA1/START domain